MHSRQNFHVYAYSAPWYNRYGWTRFTGKLQSGKLQ